MITPSKRLVTWLLALATTAATGHAQSTLPAAESEVAISIDPSKPGAVIPADFAGISLEMQSILPSPDNSYIFRPDNKPLLAMFNTLGIHSLRLGGYTADSSRIAVPSAADIDNIFAFAKAAHNKIIFTLRHTDDPAQDTDTAKYILEHYKNDLTSFGIGNEPMVRTYDDYKELFNNFVTVLKAPDALPDISFCGPNTLPGREDWAKNLIHDFAGKGCLNLVTVHAYFGGSGRAVDDVSAARTDMLSAKWLDQYQTMLDGFASTAADAKLPFRLEETNSFFSGGAPDVSNTHAAALWGLDYLHWWAVHNAAGINFHNGSKIGDPAETASCWYAPFWASETGFHVHPLGYAMKAFDLGSHGAVVPVKLSKGDDVNLTAYAVVASDKTLYVTLINKESSDHPKAARIRLFVTDYDAADTIALTADRNDLSSTDTEKLGEASIGDDGAWSGAWTPLSGTTVEVPAASALVMRLHPR